MQKEDQVERLLKAWVIPWNELVIKNVLGRGSFGVVAMAEWHDLNVAVKCIDGIFHDMGSMYGDVTADMDREISLLQQVRHPNIVLFLGAGINLEGLPFLVTELMEFGCLSHYLQSNKLLSWNQKISFAIDSCAGMDYLHSVGCVHRDLKSGNLLVSKKLCVKVADFGTSSTLTPLVC